MKGLYRNLLVTTFLVSFATTIFTVFLPSYFDEIGLTYAEIGFSLGFLNLIAAFASLFVGYLEEEVDKIKILISSYFGYAVLPVLYLAVGSFMSTLFVRVVDAIATSLRYVAEYTILESKTAYRTGVNISLNESMTNLGSLLGPLFAGALALHYGIDVVFVVAFVVLLFVSLYSLRLLKFSKPQFNHKVNLSLFKEEFSHKPLIILSLLFLLFSTVDASKFLAVTLYMKTHAFNDFLIALVAGSFFFFTFLFELFSGYMEKKATRNRLLTIGMLLCGSSIFLFSVVPPNLYYFLVFALFFSLGTAFIRPAIFSDLVSVGGGHPNIGTGIMFFFANIGGVIGLMAAGLLIGVSFDLFFIAAGLVLLAATILSLLNLKALSGYRRSTA